MPIVGQFGSLAGLGPLMLPGGAMESIATVTVGSGGASSITFSDIPGGFQHLQIRATWRASTASEIEVSFNSDTTNTNYRRHLLYGTGGSAVAGSGQLRSVGGYFDSGTNVFTGSIIDVLDYGSTSKNTTVRSFWGTENNSSGYVGIYSMLWVNTNAVTSIALTPSGGTFSQFSSYALYGLRAP